MFDSTRTNTALLDESGKIVDVNQGWHAFAEANGFVGSEHGLGSSYLDICARAVSSPHDAADAGGANEAQQAVQDVLAGRSESATLLQACHSPDAPHWFELTVAPAATGGHRGAVLRYREITARVLAERQLHRQSEVLEAVGTGLPIIIFQRFRRAGTWDYIYASESVGRMFGCNLDDLNGYSGDRMLECIHEEDRKRVIDAYRATIANGGGVWRSEFRIVDDAGAVRWMDAMVRVRITAGLDETESLWVLHDLSEQKLADVRARQVYEHDDLTGLVRRAYFESLVDATLGRHVRGEPTCALIVLDVDGFKEINEVYGRAAGDKILQQIGAALQAEVRNGDIVAYLGADEFGMLCEARLPGAALLAAGQLVDALFRTYDVEGQSLTLSMSVGVSVPHGVQTTVNGLLQEAESAVERARAAGGNRCLAYSPEMTRESSARVALRDGLRDALERGNQFELRYQPQVDILSGQIVGCEALLRWHHPVGGWQSPADFIPIAEKSGLIVPIGRWVMLGACWQYMEWRAAGLPPTPISINVSVVQFTRSNVPELISHALQATGAPPGAIDIEITETALADCSDRFVQELEAIRRLGVGIQLDDFGTGFSSLAYLRRLPLSLLKIDQIFARGAVSNAKDAAIVRSVVDLASNLGLSTIVEGIETVEQLNFAREAGCDVMQGFFVSPALPAAEFGRFLIDDAASVALKVLARATPPPT